MEKIDDLELRDDGVYPSEEVLKGVLGESFNSYESLIRLTEVCELENEWRYYRDGKAWLCKFQYKKRTIIWMSVHTGYIKASVYFPLSKIELVNELDISQKVKDSIEATESVGKSKPCTFTIDKDVDLHDFEKVVLLKIRTK